MAVSPANGLTQVPINARVMIQFNEPVNAQTLGQVTLTSSAGPVPVLASLSNANQTLNLVPLITLRPNTQYTLSISGVTDLSGLVVMTPVTTSFTTGSTVDFAVPQVVGVNPLNGATGVPAVTTIQVQFNKSMNSLTVTASTFNLSIGGNQIAGTISVASDGRAATVTPGVPLAPGTYTVRVSSGIVDLGGQAVSSFQSTFTVN